MNDDRPKKSFIKVPANYAELSEEERKQWAAETGAAIVESLKKRESKTKHS
jgi:hypothetical protein